MPNNVRFFYDNLADGTGVTYTGSTTATGFDADHVSVDHLQVPWKSTADTADIKLDFSGGSTPDWNTMIVAGHNITSGATTLKLLSHTADAKGAATDQGSFTWNAGNLIITLGANVTTHPYIWLDVVDAANPDSAIQVGRIFVGDYFQPTTNFVPGKVNSRRELSLIHQALNGTESAIQRPKRRGKAASFPVFTEAQEILWMTMADTVGTFKPLFVGWDHTNHPNTKLLYSRFTAPLDDTERFSFLDGATLADDIPVNMIEVL